MKNKKLNIKYQKHKLKNFKILAFLICVFGFWFLVFDIGTAAQSPTPEPTPTVDPAIQQKVEERIQKVLTAHVGKKQAFVGEISSITDTTFALNTRLGKKQVKISEEAKIVGLGKKEIEFENLEIGSFAIVMGYLEETGILNARRIVITKKPEVPSRLVAFGEVTDKSSVAGEKILKVKHPKKDTPYEVEVTTKKITKKIEGEMEKIGFEEIEIGDRLVAIGTPTEGKENFLTAKVIHVIPGKAVGVESPSPEVSPTP